MFSKNHRALYRDLDQLGLSLACMAYIKMCKLTRVPHGQVNPLKLGHLDPQNPHSKTKLYGYLNLDFLAQVTS